jgi:ribosomal-protein-serine acetyltransferase
LIGKDAELRILTMDAAGELFALIERNRTRLGDYLPWVHATHGVGDVETFIRGAAEQYAAGLGFQAGIRWRNRLAGCAGIHPIDREHRNASVGYWIDSAAEGKGLVTRATAEMVRICFDDYHLHRVEIRCASGNVRSAAIPLRLGFREEGTLREAQLVNGRWLDLRVFGRLAQD